MANKFSNTYTYLVADLLQNRVREASGPTETEAGERAAAYVKRIRHLQETIGELTVKVTYYFKSKNFVNRLTMPSSIAGGTATVYKSRADLMLALRKKVVHPGMDGRSAADTVTSFFATVNDVKADLVNLAKRKFEKIQNLGIWPKDIADEFQPALYDPAALKKRIMAERDNFEPGSASHYNLVHKIQQAVAASQAESAAYAFDGDGYELNDGTMMVTHASLDDNTIRIMATLLVLGVPDLRMLQPFAGGTGRPNSHREEFIMACFMLVAVFERIRVMYEALNISNAVDLEELIKRAGAPTVLNDTWATLLLMSRRDACLTKEIMTRLCPYAGSLYVSIIDSHVTVASDMEEPEGEVQAERVENLTPN